MRGRWRRDERNGFRLVRRHRQSSHAGGRRLARPDRKECQMALTNRHHGHKNTIRLKRARRFRPAACGGTPAVTTRGMKELRWPPCDMVSEFCSTLKCYGARKVRQRVRELTARFPCRIDFTNDPRSFLKLRQNERIFLLVTKRKCRSPHVSARSYCPLQIMPRVAKKTPDLEARRREMN